MWCPDAPSSYRAGQGQRSRARKDGYRPLDWVSVKGKNTAVLVYELLGLKGETAPEREEMAAKFAQALHAYRRQEWTEALRGFEALLELWPEDAPAREMKRRCEAYREQPPGAGWDGVHHMESK